MSTLLIVGASRGLGAALAQGLARPGDTVYAVSRTEPTFISTNPTFHWIPADLSDPHLSTAVIARAIGSNPLDVVIYNAGIWERQPYRQTSADELLEICHVNLCTPVVLLQRLLPNIEAGHNSLVVLIGSTCGLENEGAADVAYTATKFGLRGLASALRETLRPSDIRVTCLSPGSIASDVDWTAGPDAALQQHDAKRIPVADIVTLINTLRTLSPATCAKEIVLPAQFDTDL